MTTEQSKKLWESYKKNKKQEDKEKLILEYAQLVKIIAGKLSMYLNYMVEYEDLCSFGVIGLIDAIDKYDIDANIKFETYASLRIRGEMLDQVRKLDWVPRTVRKRTKELREATFKLQNIKGRNPTDEELMNELGLDETEYYKILGQANCSSLLSLDEQLQSDDGEFIQNEIAQTTFTVPEESVLKEEMVGKLSKALDKLTDKEKKVITLYYYEELTLKEVAQVLEVTESRVSQLHTKALVKLKNIMGDYSEVFFATM